MTEQRKEIKESKKQTKTIKDTSTQKASKKSAKKKPKPKKKVYQLDIERECLNCWKKFTRREVKFYSRYCSYDCFNKHKDANHWGRDTIYIPDLPDKMLQYFQEAERKWFRKEIVKESFYKDWQVKTRDYKIIADNLPFFSSFCETIDLNYNLFQQRLLQTTDEWQEKFPELNNFYKQCQEIQKRMLVANWLSGVRNAAYNIFIATNITNLENKASKRVEHTWKDWEELRMEIYVPDNNRYKVTEALEDKTNTNEVINID